MKVSVDVLQTQKAGNNPSQCEDACWPFVETTTLVTNRTRIAIADGATDAVYSGLSARSLVKAYGRRQLTDNNKQAALGKTARVWERIVRSHPLPWYAEEKARFGSFATLLGLEFFAPKSGVSGCWAALARRRLMLLSSTFRQAG